HGDRDGQLGAGGVDRADAGGAGGGGGLRERAGDRADGGADADHRQLLPAAEPVERELRGQLRVDGPGDQPVLRLPDRLADDHGVRDRRGGRGRGDRPFGAGGVHLGHGEHLDRHRDRDRAVAGDAGHRGRGDQDHRPHPGLHGRHRVRHPDRLRAGRAAIIAVAILTVIYLLAAMGLQGAVSQKRLEQHDTSALVYAATAIGGSGWGKVMALALALSVIAATGTNIVLTARITYGMASYHTLPGRLASVSRRFATPVPASVVTGVVLGLILMLVARLGL